MFKCSKCGACCQMISKNDIYKELDRGDGLCKYYSESKKECMIYDDRPLICRVDDYYQANFALQIDIDTYYKLNYESCEKCRKLLKEEER